MNFFNHHQTAFRNLSFKYTLRLFISIFALLIIPNIPIESRSSKFLLSQKDYTNCLQPPRINRKYEKTIDAVYQSVMSSYALRHYGINDWQLKDPKIVVVHATYVSDLKESLAYFTGNRLRLRPDLVRGGRVNIGTHFLVDRNGEIYSLIPLSTIARHAVGINYTAIGIENVAHRNPNLTKAQLISNLRLIAYLKKLFPSIKFVIGHHEYNDKKSPHYPFVLIKDKKYKQWYKTDPGNLYMKNLRLNFEKCGISPDADN